MIERVIRVCKLLKIEMCIRDREKAAQGPPARVSAPTARATRSLPVAAGFWVRMSSPVLTPGPNTNLRPPGRTSRSAASAAAWRSEGTTQERIAPEKGSSCLLYTSRCV